MFFLFMHFAYAQTHKKKTGIDFLYHSLDSLYKSSKNREYNKLLKFVVQRKHDSCYISSGKLLLENKPLFEKDLLNYIQGTSALGKNLYKKAFRNFKNISNEYDELFTLKLLKLGEIYMLFKDYEQSINYFLQWEQQQSNTRSKIIGSNQELKAAYHNLALNYIHIKKYDIAKEYRMKEISVIEKGDIKSIIIAITDIANTYYNQFLDSEAIPLFKEAYELAKYFPDYELKQITAKNMAVVNKNKKRYIESIEYYEECIQWKDSIYDSNNIWELTEKEKKIALDRKQQQIALQKETLKSQRIIQKCLLIGASGLLFFLGFLGYFYTKLKRKNKLITKQKEDLNQANKTKDYLFSVVSHDLRSPIETIKSQHIHLKKYIQENDITKVNSIADSAIAVTDSTTHILNNVLHWSLEQSNQLMFNINEYPLQPLMEQVLHDYTSLIEVKGLTIQRDLQNEIIKIDKESLKIILRNLLDNAMKYMGGEGEIFIQTGVYSENLAFITVEDTGLGIAKEKLEKINNLRNLTIDKIDRSKGVGLGLLLCQTLVKKNKGSIFFESVLGKGTKITILLARVKE